MRGTLFVMLLGIMGFAVAQQDRIHKVHDDPLRVNREFENIESVVQPKITMALRNPVFGDTYSEGSLWYNTDTNKLWIREKTGWVQLN